MTVSGHALRAADTTGAPKLTLGTNTPSWTEQWSHSQPAAAHASSSEPSARKLALATDGATIDRTAPSATRCLVIVVEDIAAAPTTPKNKWALLRACDMAGCRRLIIEFRGCSGCVVNPRVTRAAFLDRLCPVPIGKPNLRAQARA